MNVERDAKRGDKTAVIEKAVLERLKPHLDNGSLANSLPMTEEEEKIVKSLHLLTLKPFCMSATKKDRCF